MSFELGSAGLRTRSLSTSLFLLMNTVLPEAVEEDRVQMEPEKVPHEILVRCCGGKILRPFLVPRVVGDMHPGSAMHLLGLGGPSGELGCPERSMGGGG